MQLILKVCRSQAQNRLQYLSSDLSNIVQPVHHVVQQLELILAQTAKEQRPRRTTRLDDARDVLHNAWRHDLLTMIIYVLE